MWKPLPSGSLLGPAGCRCAAAGSRAAPASARRRRTAAIRTTPAAPSRPAPTEHRRHDQLPGQAGEEDHRHAGRQHQQRGAQVGLLHDQPHRHHQQHPATMKSSGRNCPSRFWNHQASISGIAILRISLGWITTPTLSQRRAPFLVMPNTATAISSAHPQHVQRHRETHQPLRRDLGHHEHDGAGDQHVAGVVDEAGAVVEARTSTSSAARRRPAGTPRRPAARRTRAAWAPAR